MSVMSASALILSAVMDRRMWWRPGAKRPFQSMSEPRRTCALALVTSYTVTSVLLIHVVNQAGKSWVESMPVLRTAGQREVVPVLVMW
jgi:hypothetical protein